MDTPSYLELCYYKNESYTLWILLSVNAGESLTNWLKHEGLYDKFVSNSLAFMISLWVIHWHLW